MAYNNVAQPEAFKANALDKVRRLRNHASIALWCGANETHPNPDLDSYLREMIAREDNNDRLYKSCSNKDGLSGSGWWANFPPKHHLKLLLVTWHLRNLLIRMEWIMDMGYAQK